MDLPVVGFCRSKYGEFPEYHTSADNMSMVSAEGFQGSYEVMTQVILALEYNENYRIKVLCEPQLGKRGLYPTISKKNTYNLVRTMMNFIAYADGKNDLIQISEIIGCKTVELIPIIKKMLENGLVECV